MVSVPSNVATISEEFVSVSLSLPVVKTATVALAKLEAVSSPNTSPMVSVESPIRVS